MQPEGSTSLKEMLCAHNLHYVSSGIPPILLNFAYNPENASYIKAL